jgi:WD40 repeat protein
MAAAQTDQKPQSPAKAQMPLTDLYGDLLPEGAVGRLGTSVLRHVSGFTGFYLAPDEKLIASTSAGDTTIRIWDAVPQRQLFRLAGHSENNIIGVAFSPDSRLLATCGHDRTVRLWDLQGRKQQLEFRGHNGSVFHVVFLAGGNLIASSGAEGVLLIWEVATGKVLRQVRLPGHIAALAASPDGKTVAAGGGDATIRVYACDTGKEVAALNGHQKTVCHLAFSPDGKLLASSSTDQSVRVWDLASKQTTHVLEGAERGVSAQVAFSTDGKILAAATDGPKVSLWDPKTGKSLRTVNEPGRRLCEVAFTRDGKMLLSDNNGSAGFWDARTGKQIATRPAHHGKVTAVAFTPDGKTIATGSDDQTVRLWDAVTSKQVDILQGPMENTLALVISANGNSLACSSGTTSGLVHVWDLKTRKCKTISLPGDRHDFQYWLAISPDGKTVACSSHTDTAFVMDVSTGKVRFEIKLARRTGQRTYTNPLTFSPDGKTLAVAHALDTQEICVFDSTTGALQRKVAAWGGEHFLSYASDGESFVFAEEDPNAFSMVDAQTGKVLTSAKIRPPDQASIWACGGGVSADGRLVAVTTFKTIEIFELATGERVRSISHGAYRPQFVAFSPDGRTLVCPGPDADAIIWSLAPAGFNPGTSGKLSPAELENLWTELASSNAAVGQKAVWLLAAAPSQATTFLDRKLKRLPPVDANRLKQLIHELDDNGFKVREAATNELRNYGRRAECTLRKTLAEETSLEVRRRVQLVLAALGPAEPMPLQGDALRAIRAVQVLEQVGTLEAVALLKAVAEGSTSARAAKEANAAVKRFAKTNGG